MDDYVEHGAPCFPPYPLIRIITFGEFAIERLVSLPGDAAQQPRYAQIPWEEWHKRGTAVTLLKILLCRPHRQAARQELIEAIWSERAEMNTAHALDSAASALRRRILGLSAAPAMPGGESLLYTIRKEHKTVLKLAPQSLLWVDADAFLTLASQALRAGNQGQTLFSQLTAAHALARGEFLEDDLDRPWAQGRRYTVNGARRRVLYKLVENCLREQRPDQAEELLFVFLEDHPTDEDALCHLMSLLAKQERRQEALQLYRYTTDVLREEHRSPAPHTIELAQRIQQGLAVREQGASYITPAPELHASSPTLLTKSMAHACGAMRLGTRWMRIIVTGILATPMRPALPIDERTVPYAYEC